MTTYLIASNEMMCRILARRMEAQDIPTPVRWHGPDWLLDGMPDGARAQSIDNPDQSEPLPEQSVEMALVDCSGVEGDPCKLLDRVRERLAPRRWLVLSDSLDARLMAHAALLGASGCLAVPAPVELVCAAATLVWAGGQCFPRSALSLLRAVHPPRVQEGCAPEGMSFNHAPRLHADGSTAIG
ncbi:DNA-binding response regulator [Cupriavidus sp. SW-Y-13]|uniref:DNA-binding response regulator n=1 Tax=Cupriavidus sp. SW-Y-13 TaxID=2653854 RepID=UPI001F3386D6|nr:DNA-binding response regulator [Cupriavidus sp. SW-Y-13]